MKKSTPNQFDKSTEKTKMASSLGGRMAQLVISFGRLILFVSCFFMVINQFALFNVDKPERQFDSKVPPPRENFYIEYLASRIDLVIEILGLIGAITKNPKCLGVFGGVFIITTVPEIYDFYDDYKTMTDDNYEPEIFLSLDAAQYWYSWYNKTGIDPPTRLWNKAHETFKCCGIRGRSDWDEFRPEYLSPNVLPDSCCSFESADGLCRFENAYEEGCLFAFHRTVNKILTSSIRSIIFHLMLAVLAFCVARFRNGGPSQLAKSKSGQTGGSVSVA